MLFSETMPVIHTLYQYKIFNVTLIIPFSSLRGGGGAGSLPSPTSSKVTLL